MYAIRSFFLSVSAALALGAAPCMAHELSGAEIAAPAATAQPAPAMPVSLGRLQVLEAPAALFAGAEAAGSALGEAAAPSGTLAQLASAPPHEAQLQRVSRRPAPPAPDAEVPLPGAPSGGMALLIGLAVVVFVAYRKLSFKA